jgi:hypothetical protein
MAMLAPIGILLAFVRRRFSIWPVLAIGIGLSTAVEVTQYLGWLWRVADVDDVICHLTGAQVGAPMHPELGGVPWHRILIFLTIQRLSRQSCSDVNNPRGFVSANRCTIEP